LTEFDVFTHSHSHSFHAIFNRANPTVYDRASALKANIWNAGRIGAGDNISVLVTEVEIVNGSKQVVPSIVWLQCPDYFDDLWAGAVYVSVFDGVFKVLPFSTERKINFLGIDAINSHKFTSEDVQSSSQVMNAITDDCGKILRNFLSNPYNQHTFFGVRILLDNDSIRLSPHVSDDFVVEISDVLFGPFNL
jgi:hypothetical protein